MNSRILVVSVLLMLALSSCSSEDNSGNVMSGAQSEPVSEDPQHVWKGQVKALEKARNVENDLNAAQQQREDELERQMR